MKILLKVGAILTKVKMNITILMKISQVGVVLMRKNTLSQKMIMVMKIHLVHGVLMKKMKIPLKVGVLMTMKTLSVHGVHLMKMMKKMSMKKILSEIGVLAKKIVAILKT